MTASRRAAARPKTRSAGPLLRWWRGKSPILRFGLTFAALMAAYYAIVEVAFFDRLLLRFLEWNAEASGALLNMFGENAQIRGTVISSAHFTTNVRRGCDAVEPAWFFASAILAYPAPWRRKWFAIAGGTLLISAVNILRIASLFVIGVHSPGAFNVAHLELWPAAFILLAAGLWIGWLVRLKRPAAHA